MTNKATATKKIDSLTPEQEALIPVYRERYRAIGLDCTPIDPVTAEAAVKNLYAAAQLAEPEVRFYQSPMQCLIARGLMLSDDPDIKAEAERYPCELSEKAQAHITQLKKDNALIQTPWTVGGSDAFWVAFYDYARELGVEYSCEAHLDAYIEYIKTCGWMFAYEGIAFVSDRPEHIHFNEDNKLHDENGPAIRFRDGYSLWAVNGERIPRKWQALLENGASVSEVHLAMQAHARLTSNGDGETYDA